MIDSVTIGCASVVDQPSLKPGGGRITLLLGVVALAVAITLTIRTYMPCPFWDEWDVIADIAKGQGPWSWAWLWSQHNEHRIVVPRLLIWLDVTTFGGRNISLFVELWAAQILHWIAICFAIQRFTPFPAPLKRILQGTFAICLFNLSQAQNLTWAFQISFILSFAVGTTALLSIAFLEKLRGNRTLVIAWAGFAPMLAALNLASGLLIGPVLVVLACLKGLRRREMFSLMAALVASILLYLHGYSPENNHSPLETLRAPLDLLSYALSYLDASCMPFSSRYQVLAGLSLICLGALTFHAFRNRRTTTDFEWFCLAECFWVLAIALVTGTGRLQFGVRQAGMSRYQTPAMLYWASLCALTLIAIWRMWPSLLEIAQRLVLLGGTCSLLLVPVWWMPVTRAADARSRACMYVRSKQFREPALKLLYPRPGSDTFERAARFLFR